MGPAQKGSKEPRLNPELTKLAMEDPPEYVRQMEQSGRKDQVTLDDKVRAATMGFARKLGLGKKKQ